MLLCGVIPPQVKDPVFATVEFEMVLLCPTPQPIEGSPSERPHKAPIYQPLLPVCIISDDGGSTGSWAGAGAGVGAKAGSA